MTRVLLITGARSLADSPDAERWARALITEALAGCDLLIVGDARGPDEWAVDIATSAHVRAQEYVSRWHRAGWIQRWIDGAPMGFERWAAAGSSTHPLRRNAAMVADCKRLAAEGHDVRVLALLDGRKPAVAQPGEKRPTRGTEHTVGLAERAGLTVRREVWPTECKEVSDG